MSQVSFLHMLLAEPDSVPSHCGNCGWSGVALDVEELISDVSERLSPGGEVPVGECPECGSLAYVGAPGGSPRDVLAEFVRTVEAVYDMQGDGMAALEAEWYDLARTYEQAKEALEP